MVNNVEMVGRGRLQEDPIYSTHPFLLQFHQKAPLILQKVLQVLQMIDLSEKVFMKN